MVQYAVITDEGKPSLPNAVIPLFKRSESYLPIEFFRGYESLRQKLSICSAFRISELYIV